MLLYSAVGATQDRLITPAVMQSQLNIPSAALILFQLVAAVFFGFVGLLLTVPILVILITLIRELYIYDVLEKERLPKVVEDADGDIALEHRRPASQLLYKPNRRL